VINPNLGLMGESEAQVKTSKYMRNDHKVSHFMDFSGTNTLMCPKTQKQTLETLIKTLGG
jgi:hypothetical protein